MPRLSVWFVRASLLHMGVGFLFGSLILHHKGIPIYPWTWKLLYPHVEIMSFGWTMQFVMGMAFWILPRFSGGRRFGRTWLGWLSLALFNGGVLMTALGAWGFHDGISLAGRLCTLAAAVLFVIAIWPRVKPVGGYALSRGAAQDSFVL